MLTRLLDSVVELSARIDAQVLRASERRALASPRVLAEPWRALGEHDNSACKLTALSARRYRPLATLEAGEAKQVWQSPLQTLPLSPADIELIARFRCGAPLSSTATAAASLPLLRWRPLCSSLLTALRLSITRGHSVPNRRALSRGLCTCPDPGVPRSLQPGPTRAQCSPSGERAQRLSSQPSPGILSARPTPSGGPAAAAPHRACSASQTGPRTLPVPPRRRNRRRTRAATATARWCARLLWSPSCRPAATCCQTRWRSCRPTRRCVLVRPLSCGRASVLFASWACCLHFAVLEPSHPSVLHSQGLLRAYLYRGSALLEWLRISPAPTNPVRGPHCPVSSFAASAGPEVTARASD